MVKLPCRDDHRFESLKCLLLEMAQQRSCRDLLDLIVERLAARPNVALARVWLVRPGDLCHDCFLHEECSNHQQCLHLVASAGRSHADPELNWQGLEGLFRRFPLGARRVGEIATEGLPIEVSDGVAEAEWIADPEWMRQEGIRGFGGQPLVHRGETLGVLAVFTRSPLNEEALVWLRMIADHAATAIANARAFEEIERLRTRLEEENAYLREEVQQVQSFSGIVGTSPALRGLLEQVELVARTEASVLIEGESGTGKELVAREIHARSQRSKEPLVRVNCAAIPRELYESEFFGHVQGAFTGAVADREGRFGLADGGTLFLDEVGEIPLDLQSKLLRVLQEGTYERVGEAETRRADVRVIAATNRNLKDEVAAGRFRSDLYYRLNVFPIHVAPLRERVEDIPLLAEHFVRCISRRLRGAGKDHPADAGPAPDVPTLSRANVRELTEYTWPGNVRELRNVVERALITSRDGRLRFSFESTDPDRRPLQAGVSAGGDDGEILTDAEMKRRERANLERALAKSDGRIYGNGGAAELLDMKPTTLASRMKKYRIS